MGAGFEARQGAGLVYLEVSLKGDSVKGNLRLGPIRDERKKGILTLSDACDCAENMLGSTGEHRRTSWRRVLDCI